ncbi:YlmH family RNA-binding protein [Bacillus sp. UMB0893]|uniref:YlmH family RNA-binding protein n=1 Tax=Bacillus sp. UMB0893 TaxID=2066053 RepID=UPI000C774DC2|nr:RNA-binding protein [Bacillus sp. UMB0893]PLR69671.1 RNA-binding protein [Bacillus sp. UMB0893]
MRLNHVYQHFRQEERHFIDQVMEWRENVSLQYSPKLTDFLDPREQDMVRAVIGTNGDVNVLFSSDDMERKRALLYPDYFTPSFEDFHVSLIEVHYPVKYTSLEHRHILGSLMSLGLKRSKFGDLLFFEDRIQLVTAKEVEDFIVMNLNEIGRSKVSLQPLDWKQRIRHSEAIQESSATVSSLRLDAVAAAIYNISRQKIGILIQNGNVKVNWKVIEQTSFECREGDTLSVRGFGRSKLLSVDGRTKKDKWKITIGKQK